MIAGGSGEGSSERAETSFVKLGVLLAWAVVGAASVGGELRAQEGPVLITEFSIEEFEDLTRVALGTSGPVPHVEFVLARPARLVVDLIGEQVYSVVEEQELRPAGVVSGVRAEYYGPGPEPAQPPGRRLDSITFELAGDLPYRVTEDARHLVIDIAHSAAGFGETPSPVVAGTGTAPMGVPAEQAVAAGVTAGLGPPAGEGEVAGGPSGEVPLPGREEPGTGVLGPVGAMLPRMVLAPPAPPLEGARLLTLEEAFELALSNHEQAKVAREEAELAKLRLRDAKRGLFPTGSGRWVETRGEAGQRLEDFKGREFTVEGQQAIYDGGRAKSLVKQAEVNLQIAERNYDRVVNDLRLQVEESFFAVAKGKHDLGNQQQIISEAKSDVEMATKRHELGLSTPLEMLSVRSQYTQLMLQQSSLEKELSLARLRLHQAMGLEPGEVVDIDFPLDPLPVVVDLTEAMQYALEHRPDLQVNHLLVEFQRWGRRVADSQDAFNVNLTGSLGERGEAFEVEDLDLDTEWFVGVRVAKTLGPNTFSNEVLSQDRVPAVGQFTSTEFTSNTARIGLFDATGTPRKEAKLNYEQALNELENVRRAVIFDVRQAYYDLEQSMTQLEGTLTELQLGEQELRIIEARAGLDEALTSEVLSSKVRVGSVRTAHGQALANYHVAVARLNHAVGAPRRYQSSAALRPVGAVVDVAPRIRRPEQPVRPSLLDRERRYGTILFVSEVHHFVVINLGERDGVREDMRFAVSRGSEEIGEIEVIRVRDVVSACNIRKIRRFLQEGDVVRPVQEEEARAGPSL